MIYKHTQIGYVIIFSLAIVLTIFGSVLFYDNFDISLVGVMVIILCILLWFASLTVMVDDKHVRLRFGYGIFWKKFSLREIVRVKQVKNSWLIGWGIRRGWKPPMWVFNVSGFDAVEIHMTDGKIYRIGTDEPEELERIILQSIR